MAPTNIEWADRVWNPVTGCTKVSAGCKNCYAETIAERFWKTQYPPVPVSTRADLDATSTFHRPRKFTDVQTHEDRLLDPLKWRKPARVFVNSMSDLFHEDVPCEFVDRVFAVMALAPQHTFLVLTKRPHVMRAYVDSVDRDLRLPCVSHPRWLGAAEELLSDLRDTTTEVPRTWPLPNVHLGVSVENQQTADERIPVLLRTPAAIRWVSYEPALGPVDFTRIRTSRDYVVTLNALRGTHNAEWGPQIPIGARLDWIVVGGESGPGARPFDVAWARSIVQQGKTAGVAVFVKQLGANLTGDWQPEVGKILTPRHLRDRKGGDPCEWPEDLRVREFPEATRV